MENYHRISGHSGREHVLSLSFGSCKQAVPLDEFFLIVLIVEKRQGPFCEQKMADLPADRIIPEEPPFTSVGADCFGPFQVRRVCALIKRYGVIFTYLAICAVHLEIAYSLDTDSFLMALRRFVTRRSHEIIPRSAKVFCRKTSNGSSILHMALISEVCGNVVYAPYAKY